MFDLSYTEKVIQSHIRREQTQLKNARWQMMSTPDSVVNCEKNRDIAKARGYALSDVPHSS